MKVNTLIDSSPFKNVKDYAQKIIQGDEIGSTANVIPDMRYFLFSAKPSAEAWRFMKENPGDRRAATEKGMKKIGCEMLGYYWGLTNGRNYILVAAPDGETAQAMLVQRLSSGLVLEYEAIELVRSSDMVAMFERLKEIEAADNTLPK